MPELHCDEEGGAYNSDGSTCVEISCPVTGACCVGDDCLDDQSLTECVLAGGLHYGEAVTCAMIDCTVPPTGACCNPGDGSCTEVAGWDCADAGGSFYGDLTTCATTECPVPPLGACCDADTGACTDGLFAENCSFQGDLFLGEFTTCATASCPTVRYHNIEDPLQTFINGGSGMAVADDIHLEGSDICRLTYYDIAVIGNGGGEFDVTAGIYDDCPAEGGMLIPETEYTWTNLPDHGSPVFLQVNLDPAPIPPNVWLVVEFSTPEAGWFVANWAEIGETSPFFGKKGPNWSCNWTLPGIKIPPFAGFWANLGCSQDCEVDEDCNDAVACTDDSCVSNVCVFTPNDALCDNGLFCDGVDECHPIEGCQLASSFPCSYPNPICDEANDQCLPCDPGECDSCGGSGTGDCFQANGTPFCTDTACCEAVCVDDPVCCGEGWDSVCGDITESCGFED